jgi:hypothetical protein
VVSVTAAQQESCDINGTVYTDGQYVSGIKKTFTPAIPCAISCAILFAITRPKHCGIYSGQEIVHEIAHKITFTCDLHANHT